MSHTPASVLLRDWFTATGWSPDHSYTNLTSSSRALLDFSIPTGLHLNLTNRPTSKFASSLALSALVPATTTPTYTNTTAPTLGHATSPTLAGQLAYVASSVPLARRSTKGRAGGGDGIDLRQLLSGHRVGEIPARPELREDARVTWLAGERVDKQDFLLFGRLYAPSPRLDALWVQRLSPTLQSLLTLVSVPSPPPPPTLSWQADDPSGAGAAPPPPPPARARQSELELKLQHDTGSFSGEYSYALGDGMWGARGLYHFAPRVYGASLAPAGPGPAVAVAVGGAGVVDSGEAVEKLVDADDAVESDDSTSAGLRGRWSAGGEVFFSAKEPAAGLSAAVRFSTLPPLLSDHPSQPPTTMTATINPLIGQVSTAYAVETSPNSAMASRFDFNLYSYDAELSVGGEWFRRRRRGQGVELGAVGALAGGAGGSVGDGEVGEDGAVKLRPSFDAFGRGDYADPELLGEAGVASPAGSGLPGRLGEGVAREITNAEDDVRGVFKWRASTSSDVALLWEGRLGDFLVSLGVAANLRLGTPGTLGARTSPVTSVGVGLSYVA